MSNARSYWFSPGIVRSYFSPNQPETDQNTISHPLFLIDELNELSPSRFASQTVIGNKSLNKFSPNQPETNQNTISHPLFFEPSIHCPNLKAAHLKNSIKCPDSNQMHPRLTLFTPYVHTQTTKKRHIVMYGWCD